MSRPRFLSRLARLLGLSTPKFAPGPPRAKLHLLDVERTLDRRLARRFASPSRQN